ncbi:hypothetical protein GA0115257_111638 [Streptomyces sp. LcepLS]|nr:hypothetical protein GA0115257_111638 [Streptomyces sp. LcepLS]
MKWRRLWRRRHGGRTPGQAAADRALHRTQAGRREVEERQSAVSETAHLLRHERERNHFAELFRASIEGRGT